MTTPTADILVHRNWNDISEYKFEWKGPEDGVVAVSKDFIRQSPEIFANLPWILEKIDEDRNTLFYVRHKKKTDERKPKITNVRRNRNV